MHRFICMHDQVLRLDEPHKNPLLSVQRVWTEAPGPTAKALQPSADPDEAVSIPFMGIVHMEEHLIPYVPDVVVSIDRKARQLTINPPDGLLAIGRQKRLIRLLEPDLAVSHAFPPKHLQQSRNDQSQTLHPERNKLALAGETWQLGRLWSLLKADLFQHSV